MNVIFTCGGTGGHINPAIALANNLRSRDLLEGEAEVGLPADCRCGDFHRLLPAGADAVKNGEETAFAVSSFCVAENTSHFQTMCLT